VLRRPQTKADLNRRILSQSLSIPMQGAPDLPPVRFATTTPWGEKLYLVPTKPLTIKQLHAQGMHLPPRLIARLLAGGETLGVFSPQGGGGASDAAAIEAGDAIGTEGAGRSFAGGSSQTRFIVVVPDGVAKVEFVLPRQSSPGANGAPIYPHSLGVTAPVHDNIAAVQVNRETDGPSAPMIWLSADGRVIKRIGDFAKLNRVLDRYLALSRPAVSSGDRGAERLARDEHHQSLRHNRVTRADAAADQDGVPSGLNDGGSRGPGAADGGG
jgi:hypothetical protein